MWKTGDNSSYTRAWRRTYKVSSCSFMDVLCKYTMSCFVMCSDSRKLRCHEMTSSFCMEITPGADLIYACNRWYIWTCAWLVWEHNEAAHWWQPCWLPALLLPYFRSSGQENKSCKQNIGKGRCGGKEKDINGKDIFFPKVPPTLRHTPWKRGTLGRFDMMRYSVVWRSNSPGPPRLQS